MDKRVPAWGLFRLLVALEDRGASGDLELSVSTGNVTIQFDKGRIVQVETAIDGLDFSSYATRSGLLRGVSQAGNISSLAQLVQANLIRPEDSGRIQGGYVRDIVVRLLPIPLLMWVFRRTVLPDGHGLDGAVDLPTMLLQAIARLTDVDGLRDVLVKVRGQGFWLLGDRVDRFVAPARHQYGPLPILDIIERGSLYEFEPALLNDERTVKALFAFYVGGQLKSRGNGGVPSGFTKTGAQPDVRSSPSSSSSGTATIEDELRAEVDRLAGATAYDILQVPVDARLYVIEMASMKAKRRFSAGRFEGVVSENAMPMIKEINQAIEDARKVLSERDLRLKYNRSLEIATAGLSARIVQIFDARDMWRKGTELLETRRVTEAIEAFDEAESLDPDEPEFKVSRAWAMLSLPPNNAQYRRVRRLLDDALLVEPELVEAHLVYAEVLRREGDVDQALNHVQRVLKLDPEHTEARAIKAVLRSGGDPAPKIVSMKRQLNVWDRVKGIFAKGR